MQSQGLGDVDEENQCGLNSNLVSAFRRLLCATRQVVYPPLNYEQPTYISILNNKTAVAVNRSHNFWINYVLDKNLPKPVSPGNSWAKASALSDLSLCTSLLTYQLRNLAAAPRLRTTGNFSPCPASWPIYFRLHIHLRMMEICQHSPLRFLLARAKRTFSTIVQAPL